MKTAHKVGIMIATVLALSLLAPPAVAQTDDIPTDETFTTNSVEVWEESIFTLRHDFEDAPTAVETGDFQAGLGDGGNTSLNRDFLGVRNAGDSITLTYNPDRTQLSSADITNNDVQVIAARVTGSGEPVTTFSDAVDLISQDNANENATFEEVESSAQLSSGENTFTHTGNAGHYVYFVVDKTNGEFSVDDTDGTIAIANGIPTIIGVEQVTFQRGPPKSVSAPAIANASGDNLSFNIDTTNQFSSNDVTHTVLIYDESKFSNINDGKFIIEVTDRSAVDENFNLSEDAELYHEINEVNGVADVEDGIEVNGIDLSDGRVSRAVSLGSVIDFVAEDIDGNAPDTTAVGDVSLDASVTANASRDRKHDLTVETEDWETGSYRYVYIGALESNASAVTTSTGSISFEEGVTVTGEGSATSDSSGAASVSVGGSSVSTTSFSGLKSGTTASVSELKDKPSSITATPSSDTTPIYVEINAQPQAGSDATVRITVDKSRFNNINNARVFRYDGTNFNSLSTIVVSQTSSEVTLEFNTRFSTFAIGEVTPSSPPSSGSGGGGGGGGLAGSGDGIGVDEPNISSELGGQATITAESEPLIMSEDNTRSTATFLESFPILRSVSFIKSDGFDEFSGTVNARAIDGEPAATGVPDGTVVSLTHVTMPDQNVSQVELRYEVPNSRLSELGTSGDELTAYRFDGSNWQEIDVEARETGNNTVATAQLSSTTTSYFALMAPAVEDGDTATGQDGDGGETSSDDAVPGFGIIVSLIAIIAIVVVVSLRE